MGGLHQQQAWGTLVRMITYVILRGLFAMSLRRSIPCLGEEILPLLAYNIQLKVLSYEVRSSHGQSRFDVFIRDRLYKSSIQSPSKSKSCSHAITSASLSVDPSLSPLDILSLTTLSLVSVSVWSCSFLTSASFLS